MIIIADSGSTKTDWKILDDRKESLTFKTIGFNPFFIDNENMAAEIRKTLPQSVSADQITYIFFYGAGCSSDERCGIIRNGLQQVFPRAKTEINTDLLGVARALFRNESGIAAILGTGSNSGIYNGKKIVQTVPSLGYFFGDEGSGTYLGKKFIGAFLKNELPSDLHQYFLNDIQLNRDDILNAIYRQPFPNRFLASFTTYLAKHTDMQYVSQLVHDSFSEFFKSFICPYKDHRNITLRCMGSVAVQFREILKTVADEYHCRLDRIAKSPIDGLAEYHGND